MVDYFQKILPLLLLWPHLQERFQRRVCRDWLFSWSSQVLGEVHNRSKLFLCFSFRNLILSVYPGSSGNLLPKGIKH